MPSTDNSQPDLYYGDDDVDTKDEIDLSFLGDEPKTETPKTK
ncbi:MAG TPA: hypothetical protein VNX65_02545 [Patescibacteria group bacterium]|jgi:hypothetical protein|nr:hypothetical protein [Patescibacteria group bacterium]